MRGRAVAVGLGAGPFVSSYGWSGLSLDLDDAISWSETTAGDAATSMYYRFSVKWHNLMSDSPVVPITSRGKNNRKGG
jgi:hypothetical protein